MDEESRTWQAVPTDLAATVAISLLAALGTVLPLVGQSLLQALLGVCFVLVVPGYAFIAALFPEEAVVEADDRRPTGPDLPTRIAYGGTLSIALVSLYGLGLEQTGIGVTRSATLLGICAMTLLFVAIAWYRRSRLRADVRFTVEIAPWWRSVRTTLWPTADRRDTVLSVLAVASLVIAVVAVGYVAAVPKHGQPFTELYLEGNETDKFPETVAVGEPIPLTVGVENHEDQQVSYAGVVELQRVVGENGSLTVHSAETVDQFSTTLKDGGNWQETRNVTLTMEGERARLVVLLYRGEVPDSPSIETAYRSVRLWITVEESP